MSNTQSKESTEPNGAEPLSGVDAILKERGSTYGDSGVNLRCMEEMWSAYKRGEHAARCAGSDDFREELDRRPNSQAHDMAMLMVIAKIARVATGLPHADNYDDMQGYTKIAKSHAIDPKRRTALDRQQNETDEEHYYRLVKKLGLK